MYAYKSVLNKLSLAHYILCTIIQEYANDFFITKSHVIVCIFQVKCKYLRSINLKV